ncbi:MAG: cytochrome b/b6 domain-containing protein [Candidatus Heimdallarchaeota archaeon]
MATTPVTKETKPLKTPPKPRTFDYMTVQRYKRSQRLHHWVHVMSMGFFFFTGFQILFQEYFGMDYFFVRTFHLCLGLFIVSWDLLFFGYLMTKYWKFNEIIPTPRDILDLAIILLCSLKILPDEKYPHYDYVVVSEQGTSFRKRHPAESQYVMKYHPAQKILTTANLVAMVVMAITGLKMADELVPGSLGIILGNSIDLLALPLTLLGLDFRFIHFLVYVYFFATTLIHLYFAVIPSNRNRLRGMVTGSERVILDKEYLASPKNGLREYTEHLKQ